MTLPLSDKQALYRDGFVVIPDLVPDELVREARRSVNRSFGQGIDPSRLTEFQHQSFCPELRTAPMILDLLRADRVRAVVEDLVGPGCVDDERIRGQLAIRFPWPDDDPPEVHPHLDGMYTPDNGLQPGDIWSHTLLVGVFLNDVTETNAGNFTAWPGSHHVYERHFRAAGPDSLLNGMPTVDIGAPVQITARAGDVLFAHYQLGHAAGQHLGPDIRYTVFFRIRHVDHESQKWEAMTDIWREWPGMTDVIGAGS